MNIPVAISSSSSSEYWVIDKQPVSIPIQGEIIAYTLVSTSYGLESVYFGLSSYNN